MAHDMKIIGLLSVLFLITDIYPALRSSSPTQNQSDLIRQLVSDDIEQRVEAFYKIRKAGVGAENSELKEALLKLLDRENQLIESTLKESNEQEGVSAKYGEGYSEYYSDLLSIVETQSDLSDKRTLSILLHGGYDPESVFAHKLMNRGEEIVPILMEMLRSDLSITRWQAVMMLGQMAGKYRSKISDRTALLRRSMIQPTPHYWRKLLLASEKVQTPSSNH